MGFRLRSELTQDFICRALGPKAADFPRFRFGKLINCKLLRETPVDYSVSRYLQNTNLIGVELSREHYGGPH